MASLVRTVAAIGLMAVVGTIVLHRSVDSETELMANAAAPCISPTTGDRMQVSLLLLNRALPVMLLHTTPYTAMTGLRTPCDAILTKP